MATVESYVPADLSYYVWSFPGSPLKVHLALNVVRQLSEQLQLADLQAAGEGLLFGKAIEGATEVLDFQSAPGHVPETVAALAQDGGKRLLVGYYRIETGNSLGLNESDLTLARTCFTQPYHVFLIIQASGFGPPNASFFFHDSNGKMPEFSFMEFPFEPSLLAGEERDRLKRLQEAAARRAATIQPSAEPRLLPPLRFRPQPPFRPGWTSRVAVGLVLLFALLCGVGVFAGSRFLQAWWSRIRSARVDVPAPSPVAIGLSAKRQNADVEITWNRESPVIAGATSGVLSIQDGSSRRDIALDIDRIRNSSVVYSPASDQVFLLLSVSTPVTTVSESVMILLPRNGPPKLYASPGVKTPGSRTLKP